jgi:hypothetical protein
MGMMQVVYVGPATAVDVADDQGNEYTAYRGSPIDLPEELAGALLRQGAPADEDAPDESVTWALPDRAATLDVEVVTPPPDDEVPAAESTPEELPPPTNGPEPGGEI